MTVEPEYEDLARELHAMRAEPRPEYARELDAKAAEWLRERPRRGLPALRFAIPAATAAAAAVVVVALVVSGGDGGAGEERLEVAVVAAEAPSTDAGGGQEALRAPPERGKAPSADTPAAADMLALETRQASADGVLVVSYQVAERARATVELAGLAAEVTLGPGGGTIEIDADGVPAGVHRLEISMRGVTALGERVVIDG